MRTQIIVLMVLFILLVCISGTLFAHADKYSSLGMAFKNEPLVCIFEPHPTYTTKSSEVVLAAENSVQLWRDALDKHSPNGNWNLDTVFIPIKWHHTASPYDFPMCDILLSFEHSDSFSYSLGYTHMNFSKSWHKFSQATIFLNDHRATQHYELNLDTGEQEHIKTTVKIEAFSITVIQNIITHEFGHTLGLGHYQITDYPIYTEDKPWIEASVMYYALDPNDEDIAKPTYVDVKMLEKIYYADGFGGTPITKIPKTGYYTAGNIDICTFRCSVFN